MEVKRRIHPGFEEFQRAIRAGVTTRQLFGKYQYIYEGENGKISLISLPNYLTYGETIWEIYCLEGKLFDDVETFRTKKEAVKRINNLIK
jgi:hypothetical protein